LPGLTEIRWHARAGQGAKTASHVLALALLRSGKSVQSFPEYGPERRGAPLRAYTRFGDRPVRRHDSIEHPDLVVVLDETLLAELAVSEGTTERTPILVSHSRDRMANVEMLGSVAAALGEPPLDTLQDAAADVLGGKIPPAEVRAAVARGYRCRS
jgi:pyruvate ferredoxin oxidoreductase gamma subunit